ncbi:MAG: winged helix-turn-helix domain-containing protein [Candidatus Pacearchaeota archaeon]
MVCPKKRVIETNKSVKNSFKVYFLLKTRPYSVAEIAKETRIPRSTTYNVVGWLENLNLIKETYPNRFVDKNYEVLEEDIENWFKEHYKKDFPKAIPRKLITGIAIQLGKSNSEEFLSAFKNFCEKNYISIMD